MPDYNPDKESHADHVFLVQDATKNHNEAVKVGAREMKLNREGRCLINDEVLAREVQKENPRDFTVTRLRRSRGADAGHTYFFGQLPEMPWKRKQIEQDQEADNGSDERS